MKIHEISYTTTSTDSHNQALSGKLAAKPCVNVMYKNYIYSTNELAHSSRNLKS